MNVIFIIPYICNKYFFFEKNNRNFNYGLSILRPYARNPKHLHANINPVF